MLQLKSYLLSGRLLHFITFLELILIYFALPLVLKINTDNSILMLLLQFWLVGYLLSLPVLSQLDARSRYQNYKQIKDQLYIYGCNTLIFQPVLKSRCQRDAALISAKELGLYKFCDDIFKKNGYRWYHLLPDFVFKKPQFLITKYFWASTFFAPTYKAKIDYASLEKKDILNRFNFDTIQPIKI